MDSKRLQELRAEHRPAKDTPPGEAFCFPWPCEDSQILDMALEAERLRAALVEIDNSEFAGVVVKAIVRSALAGTEARDA